MKRFICASLIIFSFIVHPVFADTGTTVGFVPNQIWYSKEPLVENDTVKIYTAIWNGADTATAFHVQFYDGATILGERDITVSALDIQDVSISWKVTAGDHAISAKISSSTATIAGKKEQVSLDYATTSADKQFVPVVVKKVTTADVKSQIDKAESKVKDIVPESVLVPVTTQFNSIDTFRSNTSSKISDAKNETQKAITALDSTTKVAAPISSKDKKSTVLAPAKVKQPKPLDATEKPIAYVKLFLLSIVGFIFGSKFVFYGLIVLIVFFLIRYLYFKIKNR